MAIRLAGNAVLDRLGEDEYKRISPSGQQDPTNKGKFSRNEVLAELRGRASGDNLEDRLASLRELQKEGVKFTGKAKDLLKGRYGFNFNKKGGGGNDGEPGDDENSNIPSPGVETPVNPNPPATITQNPVQDIDISFGPINGDGNTQSVGNISQQVDYSDNSVTYGDTKEVTNMGFPKTNALYRTGGNMLADPFDVDQTSPTGGVRHTPNSQEFANMWKRTIIDNIA